MRGSFASSKIKITYSNNYSSLGTYPLFFNYRLVEGLEYTGSSIGNKMNTLVKSRS